MLCKVDECGREATYKAVCLCQKHYFRLRRNGDFETHNPTATPRIEDSRGYQFLHVPGHPLATKARSYVAEHRVVLYQAIGADPMKCELCAKPLTWKTCCVDHIDENPRNNERSNLRPTCNPCNGRRGMRQAHEWDWTVGLTFEGVTKTAHEWATDPRVSVTGSTIRRRKMSGFSDEKSLFGPKKTHNGNPYIDKRTKKTNFKHQRSNSVAIEIDGQTMTAAEWSRNPDCQVSDSGIVWRIRQGWSAKDAVFKQSRVAKVKVLKDAA